MCLLDLQELSSSAQLIIKTFKNQCTTIKFFTMFSINQRLQSSNANPNSTHAMVSHLRMHFYPKNENITVVSPWNYLLQVGHVFSKGPQPNVYLICFSKSVLQGERGGEIFVKLLVMEKKLYHGFATTPLFCLCFHSVIAPSKKQTWDDSILDPSCKIRRVLHFSLLEEDIL